jgi:hypothetical protein
VFNSARQTAIWQPSKDCPLNWTLSYSWRLSRRYELIFGFESKNLPQNVVILVFKYNWYRYQWYGDNINSAANYLVGLLTSKNNFFELFQYPLLIRFYAYININLCKYRTSIATAPSKLIRTSARSFSWVAISVKIFQAFWPKKAFARRIKSSFTVFRRLLLYRNDYYVFSRNGEIYLYKSFASITL